MPVPDQELRTEPFPKLHHLGLETTFCGIEHYLSSTTTPIHQFLGIKYATIPARFRQSHLCTSYPDITDASHHGYARSSASVFLFIKKILLPRPICPQDKLARGIEETLFGISQEEIPQQDLKQDEFGCLNLNITCPAGLTPRSRLPVILWIHGYVFGNLIAPLITVSYLIGLPSSVGAIRVQVQNGFMMVENSFAGA